MTRLLRIVLGLPSLVVAGALSAQTAADSASTVPLTPAPELRRGFYGSAGLGWGVGSGEVQVNGSTTSGSNDNFTYYVATGWTVNRRLRLGLEWSYFRSDGGVPLAYAATNGRAVFYSGVATFYPSVTNDLWLKGALGYSTFTVTNFQLTQSEGGVAGGIGIGYDSRLGRTNYVVTPFVNYLGQFSPYAFHPDAYSNAPAGRVWLLQAGLGFGYRH